MNFVWMNVDQNLFKDDSAVTQCSMTGSRNGAERFDGGHKIKSVIVSTLAKGK
jgi:hypothetical protein